MGRKPLFNDTEKWCPRCKAWLPHAAFGSNRTTLSGLQVICTECQAKYVEAYQKTPGYAAYKMRLKARKRRARAAKILAEAENLEHLAKAILLAEKTRKQLVKGNECIDPGYNPDNTGVLSLLEMK